MYVKSENRAVIAHNDQDVVLCPKMANRHGLIAGATGTGKTVTLKVFAETFSDMGVPVFMADIKGDITGMCVAGDKNEHIQKRLDKMKIKEFDMQAYPCRFFDVYGEKGIPVRTTISQMGAEMLGRILQLNDTQTGILNMIFRIADDEKLLLIDLKDLKAMVQHVAEHSSEYQTKYGNITSASAGTIQRSLMTLEDAGGNVFFGEPELDITDWMGQAPDGRGYLNILECQTLFQHPLLYSTFLLWMLSELYELLPEAGDMDKPKMVFFFDEAHLLFKDASKSLLDKMEQVVRLIRSKGVGIYFITQTPQDVPDTILAQLGNKVQHALRAFTPADQKALKATAKSFRENKELDCESVLQELATGEALVSFLDEEGVPQIVQRANILPPMSSMNAGDDATVQQVIKQSPLYEKYAKTIDRESAFENLQSQTQSDADAKLAQEQQKEAEKQQVVAAKEEAKQQKKEEKVAQRRQNNVEKTIHTAINTFGREATKQLVRGLFGALKR